MFSLRNENDVLKEIITLNDTEQKTTVTLVSRVNPSLTRTRSSYLLLPKI